MNKELVGFCYTTETSERATSHGQRAFFSLALALQFLRSKGIAHMDLKPQNLLLTGDRRPILKVAGKVNMPTLVIL